jgi:hypothetical protein
MIPRRLKLLKREIAGSDLGTDVARFATAV